MTRSLIVVQHHPAEGPGELALWAARRDVAIEIHRADLGELPETNAAPCVLLGGPYSVEQGPAWLHAERRWLREKIAHSAPILGICLGSQLLADALGARVERMPQPETGWTLIEFADGSRLDALQWHEDTFSLPPGAESLARSAACAQQMFRAGTRRIGIQFHPEWNAVMVDALNTHFGDESPLPREMNMDRHIRATAWLNFQMDAWWVGITA